MKNSLHPNVRLGAGNEPPNGFQYLPKLVQEVGLDPTDLASLTRKNFKFSFIVNIQPRTRISGAGPEKISEFPVVSPLIEAINRKCSMNLDTLFAIQYEAGGGLPFHKDDSGQAYNPPAVGISLEHTKIVRVRDEGNKGVCRLEVELEPGDGYVLDGDSYTKHEHGVFVDWDTPTEEYWSNGEFRLDDAKKGTYLSIIREIRNQGGLTLNFRKSP